MASSASEFKALTFVNLPFIEERYAPGDTIPYERFEAMAEQAAAVLDDRRDVDSDASPVWTADDQIEELTAWGSISDDLNAPVHPDHLPVDPNSVTVSSTVARVKALVEEMEAAGLEIPAKMREFAEMSDKQIAEADSSRRLISGSDNGRGSAEDAGS